MKASVKVFAYAAMVSMLLLSSCNDTSGSNVRPNTEPNTSSIEDNKAAAEDNELESLYPILIADEVQKWIEEQSASKKGEKKIIGINDMYMPSIEAGVGLYATRDSNGKVEYFLNGKKISEEKYNRLFVEYDRPRGYGKRNLSIPGKIISSHEFGWVVLMTAEEIAELSEKYDSLSIEFYTEPE